LLTARAIENQCFLIAAAQGGRHENGRRTWGHSLILDPWGVSLAELAEGEGIITARYDPERLTEVRKMLPALAHRTL
jgi:nitrilase